jgi:hypothetical protein
MSAVTSPSNPFRYEFNFILWNRKKCSYQSWYDRSGVVVLLACISPHGDKVNEDQRSTKTNAPGDDLLRIPVSGLVDVISSKQSSIISIL